MAGNEDALFICEYVVDRKKYIAWAKDNASSGVRLGFTVFWCVFAAIVSAIAVYDGFYLLLLLGALFLYRGLAHWRVLAARQYSLLAKRYGTENWVRSISFGEDNIVTAEGNLSLDTSCSELTGIEEKGNYIRLRLKDRTAIRLYSDCFVKGTWEECRAHLRPYISSDTDYDRNRS